MSMAKADFNGMVNFVTALPSMAPEIFHEIAQDAKEAVGFAEEVFTNPQAAETQAVGALQSAWSSFECVFKDCGPGATLMSSCSSVSSVLARIAATPATTHVTTTTSTSVSHTSASTQATKSASTPSNTGAAAATTTAMTRTSVIVTSAMAQTTRTLQSIGSAAAVAITQTPQGDGSRVVPFGGFMLLATALVFVVAL